MANDDRVEQLLDIEAIKQLKARYFRFLDTKEFDKMADLFTEDAELSFDDDTVFFGGTPGGTATPAMAVERWREFLGPGKTVHHGHMPEIEITGEGTARGIWAMIDYVEFRPGPPRQGIDGYGHYHEEYVKRDGAWKIASMRLTRLRIDGLPRGLDPPHWEP
jgi:SnoaL-like domain